MASSTTFQDSSLIFTSAESILSDVLSSKRDQDENKVESNKETKLKKDKETKQKEKKEEPQKKKCLSGYPTGAFFCLGNEFAERFSFYGMRSILTMYMINIYDMSDRQAKSYYHAFVSLAYFTPLLGSFLADGFCGRYRVILYLTLLYFFGHVILVMSAIPQLGLNTMIILDFVGLFVIAFGTGGIKPCVSAFACDQFPHTMTLQRKRFSSFFYFSITFGSLISELTTPELSYINCLGQKFCYPLAFGVPAVFVLIGLILFIVGKKFYKIIVYKENVLCQVIKCVCYALKRSRCNCGFGLSWLDLAKSKYDPQLVDDVKSLFRVIVLTTPAIIFWALFDQQGSSWVIQASRMDGHFKNFTVRPSQVSFLNPLFVLILVPIFYLIIYPILWPRNFLLKPLRRMVYGFVFAILCFIVAGVVHLYINDTLIVKPDPGKSRYVIVNMGNCDLVINQNGSETFVKNNKYAIEDYYIPFNIENIREVNCSDDQERNRSTFSESSADVEGQGHVVVFWENGFDSSHHLAFDLVKPVKGQSKFYVLFHPKIKNINAIMLTQNEKEDPQRIVNKNDTSILVSPYFFGTTLYDIELRLCFGNGKCTMEKLMKNVHLQNGGIYCFVLGAGNSTSDYKVDLITLSPPNSVSILWMIPQFFLITVAEILFYLPGSEFSYGQAALSMKSILQACWLTSVAFGNVLDMIISMLELFHDAAIEYFFYAGLMFISTIVFILLANSYKYIDRDKIELDRLEKESSRDQLAVSSGKSK